MARAGTPQATAPRRPGLGLALATLAVIVGLGGLLAWLSLASAPGTGGPAVVSPADYTAPAISLTLPPPVPQVPAGPSESPGTAQPTSTQADQTDGLAAAAPAATATTAAGTAEGGDAAGQSTSQDPAPSASSTITEATAAAAGADPEKTTDPATVEVASAAPAVEPAPTAPTAAPAVGADRPAPPDPALTEPGPTGPLPRIGDDGRTPWRAYARPFDPSERRPRIAVIVSWLGLSRAATETAIQNLPAGVTLAFSPYADDLDTWLARARAAGHETLLNLPMEPVGYPVQDPGPNTLLTGLPADENRARLQWLLSRVSGYVGVINHMGSRFTTTPDSLRPVLDEVRVRGLLFVDSRAAADSAVGQVSRVIGLPYVVNDRNIDHQATRDAIDAQLAEIEQIAARTGQAVAVGLHFPVTLERLALWLPTLEAKGFVLAPVSTMLENPEVASAAPAP